MLQCKTKFRFTNHLEAGKLLLVNDFPGYTEKFPNNALIQAVAAYLILEKEKLRTEFIVLYARKKLCNSDNFIDLWEMMNDNHLRSTFSEAVKLLKNLKAIAMTIAVAEKCFSTLKRIKTLLRSIIANDRPSAQAMISIENIMITEMKNLNQLVINHFSTSKSRRSDFLFK